MESANEKAAADAMLLASLAERPDRIGWRLTEDLTLSRAIIWDGDAKLLYPAPDGFTPLLYEFNENDTRRLTALMAKETVLSWSFFDASGNELLNCRPSPAICLLYDRRELEEMLGMKEGALLSSSQGALLPTLLIAIAAIAGSLAVWVRREAVHQTNGFKLLPERHSAQRGSLEVSLSPRDLKLLTLLDERNGAVATKDELYDAGWGREFMPNSRALDQHMINLRRKLDPQKSLPILIETVHGVGYRLVQ